MKVRFITQVSEFGSAILNDLLLEKINLKNPVSCSQVDSGYAHGTNTNYIHK